MQATDIVLILTALALGVALGWSARAARTAGALAAARTETEALRAARAESVASLARASEDAARRQSGAIGAQVSHIVEPLRSTLAQLGEELRRTEHNRVGAYAGLSEQVRGIHAASLALGDQTRRLTNALHSSHSRGRWGEVQLERVVELAGMARHCDFDTQVSVQSADGATLRPDLVVHLAGGRDIVVDAKAPLEAYLRAAESTNDAEREHALLEHARTLRNHVARLSAKSYWKAFDNTPELVVLFVPADAVLEAAVRTDPALIEDAFGRNVVLATPSTLIALLRTVALGWRHDAMAREAATIHALGTQLHQRLDSVLGHLDTTGAALQRAVESYNTAVGVVETRIGVTARRLAALEALGDVGDPPTPRVIHTTCRTAGSATSPDG